MASERRAGVGSPRAGQPVCLSVRGSGLLSVTLGGCLVSGRGGGSRPALLERVAGCRHGGPLSGVGQGGPGGPRPVARGDPKGMDSINTSWGRCLHPAPPQTRRRPPHTPTDAHTHMSYTHTHTCTTDTHVLNTHTRALHTHTHVLHTHIQRHYRHTCTKDRTDYKTEMYTRPPHTNT